MNRVFITGATGFVGSALTCALIHRGYEITLLSRSSSDLGRINGLKNKVHIVQGNLNEIEKWIWQIASFRPNTVIHLGWAGVKAIDRNELTQINNVASSVSLFRYAESFGCEMFIGMGSQAEYGPLPGRISESMITQPTTLYGASKLSTYLLLDRMAQSKEMAFAWLRLFSSYGPGDDPSWMLQYLARSLLKRERPSLTAAEQMWDYIYIDDVATAIIATMEKKAKGLYNLGSGQSLQLKYIIEKLRDKIDPGLPIGFGELPYREDQVMHLEADISRLKEATGWSPITPLDEGLSKVIKWIKDNQ